jgi:chemosensory pili system protein ChpA (sensor histidine kinase/response regulator)
MASLLSQAKAPAPPPPDDLSALPAVPEAPSADTVQELPAHVAPAAVPAEDGPEEAARAAVRTMVARIDADIRELDESRGDLDTLIRLQGDLHNAVRPLRRLGYRTFGTLASAAEQAIGTQLQSLADPPEELFRLLRETGAVARGMADGTISRNKTHYDLITAFEAVRSAMEELSAEERERRQEEFRQRDAHLHPAAAEEAPKAPRAHLTELHEIFLQEMGGHLDSMTRDLLRIEQQPGDRQTVFALMRSAHSIKGSSAIVGLGDIAALAHAMEDVLVLFRDRELPLAASAIDLMLRGVDVLGAMMRAVEANEPTAMPEATALAGRLRGLAAFVEAHEADFREDSRAADARAREGLGLAEDSPSAAATAQVQTKSVSVDIRQLDALLNLAADLVISRTRLSAQIEEISSALGRLDASRRALAALNAKMRRALSESLAATGAEASGAHTLLDEFAGSEFDRFRDVDIVARDIREECARLDDLAGAMHGLTADLGNGASLISQITQDLHESIMRTRMLPVGTVFSRFPRAVRDLAQQLGKSIALEVSGEETPLDKTIIEEIADPLMHIIRNACDHGIETPEERQKAGKPARGTIRLSARQAGSQVQIVVRDDGAGINVERVREKAIERGMMTPTQALGASDEQLFQLLLEAGFSTAKEVTDVSGRGVGLDVVAQSVRELNGTLTLHSEPGEGTTFTLRLPVTLSISQALLFTAGESTYALPLAAVDEVVALDHGDVFSQAGFTMLRLRGLAMPLLDLHSVLEGRPAAARGAQPHVIVVGDLNTRTGLIVDRMIGRQEIVIKSLGAFLPRVPFVSGATVLGDGNVVLILDAMQLAAASEPAREAALPEEDAPPPEPPAADTPPHDAPPEEAAAEPSPEAAAGGPLPELPPLPPPPMPVPVPAAPPPPAEEPSFSMDRSARVLVVDDSVSIRRYVAGILEGVGMRVTTACDGIDALEKLDEGSFDLILTDLEMPRMHGYELISEVKSHARHRNTPIVILTGRMGEKHSRKGLELGAAAFLVKPFEESFLIETIRGLLPESKRQ